MSICVCGQFDLADRYCKVVGEGQETEIHRPSCDGWSYCCHGGPRAHGTVDEH